MRPGAVFFLCDLMASRYSSYVGGCVKTVWSCSHPAWIFGTLVRDSHMRLERCTGISRWAILAWNVSRERSAASQSASVSCSGPWCSGGRLKCLLNLAEAAWRHSIGSVRCSPLGPGRSCGSSEGGNSPVRSLMSRPYCFCSYVSWSIFR